MGEHAVGAGAAIEATGPAGAALPRARRGSRAATCRRSGRICCPVPRCPSGASASTRPTATSGTSTGLTPAARRGCAAGRAVARARRQLRVALRTGPADGASPRAAGAAWCRIFAAAAASQPQAARVSLRRPRGSAARCSTPIRARVAPATRRLRRRRFARRQRAAQLAGPRGPRCGGVVAAAAAVSDAARPHGRRHRDRPGPQPDLHAQFPAHADAEEPRHGAALSRPARRRPGSGARARCTSSTTPSPRRCTASTGRRDYWRRASAKPWLAGGRRAHAGAQRAATIRSFRRRRCPARRREPPTSCWSSPTRAGTSASCPGRFPGNLDWLPRRLLDFFVHGERLAARPGSTSARRARATFTPRHAIDDPHAPTRDLQGLRHPRRRRQDAHAAHRPRRSARRWARSRRSAAATPSSSAATAACPGPSSPPRSPTAFARPAPNVDRRRHGRHADDLLRRASSRHAVERDGDRQPQSARLQRAQDGDRRRPRCRAPTSRRCARASKPGDSPPARARTARADIAPAYLDRIVGRRPARAADAHRGRLRQRRGRRVRARRCFAASAARSPRCSATVDGTFPNHHPDPSKPENLADLIALLARGEHDLGLAFDGDGDRLGVVTRRRPRDLPRPAADAVRRRRARARAGRDGHLRRQVDAQSQAVDPRHGGVPLLWKTGHSLIKAQDEGGRRGACRRDERPHVLQGALVRLRRRALRRRAAARDPVAACRPVGACSTRCPTPCRRRSSTSPAPKASTTR